MNEFTLLLLGDYPWDKEQLLRLSMGQRAIAYMGPKMW